jgi:hypothetical protein
MKRRQFNLTAAGALCATAIAPAARSQSLAGLSNAEASQGLKAALERGAVAAVQLLGKQDGFLGNPKVRIPLPDAARDAAKFLRAMGRGQQVDELEVAINRAAEQAVPQARDMLVSAVKTMTVTDAKNILQGGDTSVTTFFADKTRAPLGTKFLPIVTQVVRKVGLAEKYNRVAGKAAGLGLVKKEDASIEHYVTRKALDGLYLVIGEQERQIRSDPVGTGSALLRKVFGALK